MGYQVGRNVGLDGIATLTHDPIAIENISRETSLIASKQIEAIKQKGG